MRDENVLLTLAIILAIAEIYCDHSRRFEQINLKDALIVGIAQCGALIPGVSRSGSTLTAALFRDLNREDAARFSFLLGVPAILAAREPATGPCSVSSLSPVVLLTVSTIQWCLAGGLACWLVTVWRTRGGQAA